MKKLSSEINISNETIKRKNHQIKQLLSKYLFENKQVFDKYGVRVNNLPHDTFLFRYFSSKVISEQSLRVNKF